MRPPPPPAPAPIEKDEKENEWKEMLPWAFMGLLTLLLFFATWPRKSHKQDAMMPSYPGLPGPWTQIPPFAQNPSHGAFDARGHFTKSNDSEPSESLPQKKQISRLEEEPLDFNTSRRIYLETIFRDSDTFRLYFLSLSPDLRDELFSLLKGPAYEKFLDGLGLRKPIEEPNDPQDPEDRLSFHQKQFAEFSRAKEWQDRQFFGFLQRLNEEQVMNLIHHEDAFSVCVMLRFMKPSQSALVLDALPREKRMEVLSHVDDVQTTSFQELVTLEKQVRDTVTKLPEHFFWFEEGRCDLLEPSTRRSSGPRRYLTRFRKDPARHISRPSQNAI
jgi:hypothetical protein